MNRALLCVLAGCAISVVRDPVQAQRAGITLSAVAGTWEGKTMMGPKDSVITTWVVTATADGKGWTYRRPNIDPVPVRVVATGGDSIVTEMGPLPSALRPGQTVTMVRVVGHYKGSKMTGTFEAHYPTGDVVQGKVAGTRKK